jgi:hypothetical protein
MVEEEVSSTSRIEYENHLKHHTLAAWSINNKPESQGSDYEATS